MCTANFQVIAGLFWFLLQIMCKNSCLSFQRDGFMPPRAESDRKLRCTSKLSQSRAAAIMHLVNNTLPRTSIGRRDWNPMLILLNAIVCPRKPSLLRLASPGIHLGRSNMCRCHFSAAAINFMSQSHGVPEDSPGTQ